MANQNLLKLLRDGVSAWNDWRANNPFVSLDLSEADFQRAMLKGADLSFANFERSNLWQVDFSKANLSGAALGYADLTEATLVVTAR